MAVNSGLNCSSSQMAVSLCGIATSFLHRVQLLVAIQLLFEVSRKADCYIDTIPVFNIKRGLIRK